MTIPDHEPIPDGWELVGRKQMGGRWVKFIRKKDGTDAGRSRTLSTLGKIKKD